MATLKVYYKTYEGTRRFREALKKLTYYCFDIYFHNTLEFLMALTSAFSLLTIIITSQSGADLGFL